MAACASVLAAQAEVTLFAAQGAPMCRYHGKADQTVMIPVGFNFRFPSESKQRVDNWDKTASFYEKEMSADRVQLWGVHMDGVNDVSCDHTLAGTLRWYFNRSMLITPAEGLSVTNIEMKLERLDNCQVAIVEADGKELKIVNYFSYNANDSTLSVSCNYNKPFYIINLGQNGERKKGTLRPFYFEITTRGTAAQVAVPEYNIKHNMVANNEKIELTCATPGAKIYYTIDENGKWNGTRLKGGVRTMDPTTASTLYTGPFSIEKDAVVRAIAVKDGMANSFVTFKEFYVMPAYDQMAVFDFNDHTSIKDEEGNPIADFATYPVVDTNVSTGTTQSVSLAMNPAFNNGVTFTGTITNENDETGCDLTLSNTFGGVVELRPKNSSKIFISVPDDQFLTAVYLEACQGEAIELGNGMTGNYKTGFVTKCQRIWTATSEDVYELELDIQASSQYIDRIHVFYAGNDAVNNVAVDANAPVEYFNLQGMRVENPAKGNIYIKRQGANTSKIVL